MAYPFHKLQNRRPTIFVTGQGVYPKPSKEKSDKNPRKTPEKPIPPPNTLKEATMMGIKEAALGLKQTAQGAASLVAGPWNEKFEKDRKDTQKERDNLNEARDKYYGGEGAKGFLKEAAARFPGNALKTGPEILNPFKKLKTGNALYHAGRSYASSKQPSKAITAAVSNVAGEKIEALVGNLPGNAVGSVAEKLASKAIEKTAEVASEGTSAFIASIPSKKKRDQK